MVFVMTFETTIKPWGHSLGVTLPKRALAAEDVRVGDRVEITLKKKSVCEAFGKLSDIEERAGLSRNDLVRATRAMLQSKWGR